MTTAAADLCGHRWDTHSYCSHWPISGHRCTRTADHPPLCRCRCGATTTREEGGR